MTGDVVRRTEDVIRRTEDVVWGMWSTQSLEHTLEQRCGGPVAPAGARATVEFLETRQSRLVRRTRDLAI